MQLLLIPAHHPFFMALHGHMAHDLHRMGREILREGFRKFDLRNDGNGHRHLETIEVLKGLALLLASIVDDQANSRRLPPDKINLERDPPGIKIEFGIKPAAYWAFFRAVRSKERR